MTIEQAKTLKAGDKVKIVNHDNASWDFGGNMSKWKNKVMTIKSMDKHHYANSIDFQMVEDPRWSWIEKDIACKVEDTKKKTYSIAVRQKSNSVTVYLPDGRKGTSICDKEDSFDELTGIKLALDRAYGREEKKEESQPYEFNGKAVCVEISPEDKIGKIYTFENGKETRYKYSLFMVGDKNCTLEHLVMPFANRSHVFVAIKE